MDKSGQASHARSGEPVWQVRPAPRCDGGGRREELAPSRLVQSSGKLNSQSDRQDEDQRVRGQLIHRALELLGQHRGETEILQILACDFILSEDQEVVDCYQQARAVYQDRQFAELFNDSLYEKVYNEMPLSWQQDGRDCYGVIDRLRVATDRIWLIDYKTHRRAKQKTDALLEIYREQMQAYRQGVEKLWPGRRIRLALLLTDIPLLCEY